MGLYQKDGYNNTPIKGGKNPKDVKKFDKQDIVFVSWEREKIYDRQFSFNLVQYMQYKN